jgi:hypothetical protein
VGNLPRFGRRRVGRLPTLHAFRHAVPQPVEVQGLMASGPKYLADRSLVDVVMFGDHHQL